MSEIREILHQFAINYHIESRETRNTDIDQAESAIKDVLVKRLEGMRRDTFGAALDPFRAPNIGYNQAIDDAIKAIREG